MSWGKSVEGKASELRDKAAAWPDEVKTADEGWNASDETKQGHAAQVDAARAALEVLGNVYGDRELKISAGGHANADGSGNVNVHYSFA